jgi:hypothetical protein
MSRVVIENIIVTFVGTGMLVYLGLNVQYRLLPYLRGESVEDND